MALGTLMRRLVKIEASMPSPDQKVYQFIAPQGDPCLDVEPPWGGFNILRVIVGPEDEPTTHRPKIQDYGQALKAWEEQDAAPLTAGEWREAVMGNVASAPDADPFLCAEIDFAEGSTRGKLPREAEAESARWATRLIEPRN